MAVELEIRQSEKDVGWAWREQALVVGRRGNHYANGYLQQGSCACMACVGTDLCLLYRPKYHQVWMTTTGFSLRASCSLGYSIYSAPVRRNTICSLSSLLGFVWGNWTFPIPLYWPCLEGKEETMDIDAFP